MVTLKPITIIGGGLAGLTLGIGLRQRGVPVTIHEAGRYPRHRVCGEFISGRGQSTLERFGLRELLLQSGAQPAINASFCSSNYHGQTHPLPAAALCMSRFILDGFLASRFRELGGVLREGARLSEISSTDGIVWANGRRPRPSEGGCRWFGLKIHAREVTLDADLEMHLSPNGYVGLCRLPGGEVNICGLFRKRILKDENDVATREPSGVQKLKSEDAGQLLRGKEGSLLHRRLMNARFDHNSFCAVAGIYLKPQQAIGREECCIGDALTMIPPVTGNGMSMAFESAELALDPLFEFASNNISWATARQWIATDCDTAFARRLEWSRWLHRMMFTPILQEVLVRVVSRSNRLWRRIFQNTR